MNVFIEKLTKEKIKAKLYKPTRDYCIIKNKSTYSIHLSNIDAFKNNINLSNMGAILVGNGLYGAEYKVKNILKLYF